MYLASGAATPPAGSWDLEGCRTTRMNHDLRLPAGKCRSSCACCRLGSFSLPWVGVSSVPLIRAALHPAMGRVFCRLLHLVLCWWLLSSSQAGNDEDAARTGISIAPTSKASPPTALASTRVALTAEQMQHEALLELLISQDADMAALFSPQAMVPMLGQAASGSGNQLAIQGTSSSASAMTAAMATSANLGTDAAHATGTGQADPDVQDDVQTVSPETLRQLQEQGTVEQPTGEVNPRPGLLRCESTGEWHFLNPYGGVTALVYGGTTPPEAASTGTGNGPAPSTPPTVTTGNRDTEHLAGTTQETMPKKRRPPLPLHLRTRGGIYIQRGLAFHISHLQTPHLQEIHQGDRQQNKWPLQDTPVRRTLSTNPCAQVRREQQGGLRSPHPRRAYAPNLLRLCQEQSVHWQALHFDPSLMCQGMRPPHHRQGPHSACRLLHLYVYACCRPACHAQAANLWDMRSPLPCRTHSRSAGYVRAAYILATPDLQDYPVIWPTTEALHSRPCWYKERLLHSTHCPTGAPSFHLLTDCAAITTDCRALLPVLSWLWNFDQLSSALALVVWDLRLQLSHRFCSPPYTHHTTIPWAQVDMLAQMFQGWKELTCLRQWARVCFLAWASQRASNPDCERMLPTASGIAESEPESRIRLTLVLRDSSRHEHYINRS